MNLQVITNISQIGPFIQDLTTVDTIYIDTETSSTDTFSCKLYLIQVLVGDKVYVFDCLQFNQLEYLVSLLASKICVGHNIKFDIRVLYNKTQVLLANVFDTMLGEVMLHQGIGIKFVSLYDVVNKYAGYTLDKSIRETFYQQGILEHVAQEQIIYAAEDVLYLPIVMQCEVDSITEQKMLKPMNLEMKLCPVVAMMENEGVFLNVDEWTRLMVEAKAKSRSVAEELQQIFVDKIDWTIYSSLLRAAQEVGVIIKTKGERTVLEGVTSPEFYTAYLKANINIASTKQLLNLVHLSGYPELASTAEKVIANYVGRDKDKIFEKILEFREQFKKGTSFGQSFLDDINPLTGKIHSSFHQLGTATGRFSSGNPNLQQIVAGSEYRKCFVAPPGWKMIICDYSQQELRLAGAASKEPEFINAYKNGIDLHTLTASALFEKPLEAVEKRERTIAKGFNFAVLYGSSEFGLAHNFGFPVEYTKQLLNNFYNKYQTLRDFKATFEEAVFKRKFSRTLYGRIRYFENLSFFQSSSDAFRYENGMKREGFNHLIQGTAADATKLAMCSIFYGNPFGENLKMVMTIHDEIVCIAKEDYADSAKDYIVKCMNEALQPFLGEIPSEVDSSIQDYWYKS